jgi:hypothetical protein
MPRYSRVSRLQATRCTIELPGGKFCDAPEAPDVPFPICAPHALEIYRHMNELVTEVRENYRDHMGTHVAMMDQLVADRHAAVNSPKHRVYYVRVGDMIKIGMTANVRQRVASYPPGSELLAIEAGGEDLEGRRLRQFSHLLVGRNEWFRPAPELMAHIAEVGLPEKLLSK